MGNHLQWHLCNHPLPPPTHTKYISSFHFKHIPTSLFGCSLVRICLRPGNYNIHYEGNEESDYSLGFVQDQPPILSEGGRSSQVRLNVPAPRQLSVAFLSTCHLVLQWKSLNCPSRSTHLAIPFVILDILWVILVVCQWWRSCSLRRNCGQRMKFHSASWTALLLRGGIKSKRKDCGANEVGSNLKSISCVRVATTNAVFPRSIFGSAALSRDANNRNSCLHECKIFGCCRSLSQPSSGTKPLLRVAVIPWTFSVITHYTALYLWVYTIIQAIRN